MAYPIWQATITDDNGNVLPGAEITVVNETTGLNAPLYSTRNGTSKSNPFFATVDGFAQFYAAPGLYRITATDGGTGTTQTFRYVRLVEVATTAEAIAGTAGVLPDAEQVRLVIAQDVPSASTTVAGRVEKATNQEALDGVVDKFPDAAGVHAAFKQFGLGASDVPTFPLSTDKLRFFRIAPDDPDNPFSSPTAGNAGLNIYIGGTFGCQIAASASSVDAGKIFFRNRLGNTYVAWRELYHTGNTVGTVSQSGGVPTGAIIQRGSNANGEYVRFADGTMICHKRITFTTNASSQLGRVSPAVTWVFPTVFDGSITAEGSYGIFGNATNSGTSYFVTTRGACTTSRCDLVMYAVSESDSSRTLNIYAIGRWY